MRRPAFPAIIQLIMHTSKLIVWPQCGLSRVFPLDAPPRGARALAAAGWQLCAAGGEFVSFQLGLWTEANLSDIEISPTPLRSGRHEIESSAIRVRWTGLVPVPIVSFDVEGAERPDYVPGWYPDPLLDAPVARGFTGTEANRATAVHFTLRVKRGTPPGIYRGGVTIRCGGKVRARTPLVVEIWPFRLPSRPTFHFTNWLQLDCITKWHRCAPWSERHWRLLNLYAKEMAEHRQNVVSTPTIIGNFHNSDPMTLVDITRKSDGGYCFDFRRLERWVRLFRGHGFELFEMWHLASQADGRYAPPFSFFDETRRARIERGRLSTDAAEYRKLIASFLPALTQWLERRDLTRHFLLHVFDEPAREHWPRYVKLSALFRKYAPDIRHLDAISASALITEAGADIDIPVPTTQHLDADEYYRRRARDGIEPLWWYTCCGPWGRFANRFVSMPLINTRILSWQAFTFGISGYLHWGYNFWHRIRQDASGWPGISGYADHTLVNPYREHGADWAVGDACIVYPPLEWWRDLAPVSSLRYEAMREGLQDYELLRMCDEHARKSDNPGAARNARRLLAAVRGPIAGSLTEFTRDAGLLLKTRREIGGCIAAL